MTEQNTPANLPPEEEAQLRGLAAADLVLLARLHGKELDEELINELSAAPFAQGFALLPESEQASEAAHVIDAGWELIADADDLQKRVDELAADFAALYLTHGHRVSPTESEWLDDDGLTRQTPMMEVRQWYRRHRVAAPDWRTMPDDHIALQLAFIAHMLGAKDEEGGFRASLGEITRFMDEHLLLWLPAFAAEAARRCDTPFYAGLAMFTHAWLESFRELLARLTGKNPLSLPERRQRIEQIRAGQAEGASKPWMPEPGPAV